ncbi:MAG: hypothetical protein ATN35_06745 [Epulopiscium sp. Nele67-Bin004]|nr:MAG: hypothetical protein ATN35_06745 [Epulopiscium sp. Nele67-Bin004]
MYEKFKKLKLATKLSITTGGLFCVAILLLVSMVTVTVATEMRGSMEKIFITKAEANAQFVQNLFDGATTLSVNLRDYIETNYQDLDANAQRDEISRIDNKPMTKEYQDMEDFILSTAFSTLIHNDTLAGVSIYFEQYKFDTARQNYAFDIYGENIVGFRTDYSSYSNYDYYSVPKQTLEPYVTDPMRNDKDELVVYISFPIVYQNEFRGVVVTGLLSSSFSGINNIAEDYTTLIPSVLNNQEKIVYDVVEPESEGLNLAVLFTQESIDYWVQTTSKGLPYQIEIAHNDDFGGMTKMAFGHPIDVVDMTWWTQIVIEEDELYETITLLLFEILMFTIVALAILIMATGVVLRNSLKPLEQLLGAADKMVQGDLDIQVNLPYDDEIGQLGNRFSVMANTLKNIVNDIEDVLRHMADGDFSATHNSNANYVGNFAPIKVSLDQISHKLEDTLHNISVTAKQVNGGASEILVGATEISRGTTSQVDIIDEFREITQEIVQNINNTVAQVEENTKISSMAKQKANEGNTDMQKMLEAMETINHSSNTISSVLKTIEEIASQTNLLALNAAIEAARAGDAGKGFAVVAAEIRELANRSSETVKEVEQIIKVSISNVVEGKEIANTTAKSLREIAVTIDQTAGISDNLIVVTEKQRDGVKNLVDGTKKIADIVELNATTSKESEQISKQLTDQAEQLTSMLSYFKV